MTAYVVGGLTQAKAAGYDVHPDALQKGGDWLRNTSLFTHIALVPAAKLDWGPDIVIVVLGLTAAALGAVVFHRRDVEYP